MKPRILLIGAGRFGRVHLRVLQQLHRQEKLELIGAVVKSQKTKREIETAYRISVYTTLPISLLEQADAVDIVTPTKTHFSLIKKCLPYAHVLVEKPLAENSRQARTLAAFAKKQKNIVMVGHIYRFHPVIRWLKKYLAKQNETPQYVEGKLINPLGSTPVDNVKLEFLHFFDIADYLFGQQPIFSSETKHEQLHVVYLQYPKGISARFDLGCAGEQKIRTLEFYFFEKRMFCDLAKQRVEVYEKDLLKKVIDLGHLPGALEPELLHFLSVLQGKEKKYPNAALGKNIIEVIERIKPFPKKHRPRVAIIGGGIFGASCAAELGTWCNVSLFEKKNELMREASFINQYRHHWGYHYPRSDETVEQCRFARSDFESVYNKAIVRSPAYYGIAKRNTMISGKKYVEFCRRNGLPVRKKNPPEGFIDPERFSVFLKTPEATYEYGALRRITEKRLRSCKHVRVRFNTAVVNGSLLPNGDKRLCIRKNGREHWETFDIVINATYAFGNRFARWFRFPVKPLRLCLKEILFIRLPAPQISVTLWGDNGFTTLVATEKKNVFTFGHMPTSVLQCVVPKTGLVPAWGRPKSKWQRQLRMGRRWLPILARATYLESRFVTLGINAWRAHDYARTSDITDHGFGCWSILGGKIITCITTAKELAKSIRELHA